MSRAEVLRLQDRRWRAMARYALEVSPFYRRHLAGINVERCQLSDLPPMTKELLFENWDEIVPDVRLHRAELEKYLQDPANWGKVKDGRWMVCYTTGTTAAPQLVVHDIAAVDYSHASQNLRNSVSPRTTTMPRLRLGGRRLKVVALVTSKAAATSTSLFATRPWVGALFSTYHQIDVAAPWQQVLAELQRLQPDALMGYSSVMGRLAQAQLNGELHLNMRHGGYIWGGGDALTPGIRDQCQRAFGITPFNMYGCGEVLSIARQWRGMEHLCCHDDMMVLETVDEAGRPIPEGDLADHAYVTPLINKAMPLLRYRVNDRLRLGPVHEHWPFRTLTQVHGRGTTAYTFRTPEVRVFIGMNFLFTMDERRDVASFQFRQTGPATVECLTVSSPGISPSFLVPDLEADLRRCLESAGCGGVQCTVRIVRELMPDPRTGKVEQNVPLPDA